MIYIEESRNKINGYDYDLFNTDDGMPVGYLTTEAIYSLGLTSEDFSEGQKIQIAVKKGEDPRLDMEGRSI